MSRIVFSETKEYLIEVQEICGEFHLHCLVYKWNKSVLKALYQELALVKLMALNLGHKKMYSVSPNPKFCELLCGRSIGIHNECEVMVWELN